MTQRERQTPAVGAPAPPVPTGAGVACVWEEIFEAAAPGRRQQLLSQAGSDGVIYAHELPHPTNGDVKRPLLPSLLNGRLNDLAPLRPRAVGCGDADLDDVQRDAVARALQTPDLLLIQGLPGSGKSRTAAEIAARAAADGRRVLLLAPAAAAVDCVLERLEGREAVCAARCPAPGEALEALPAGVRRLAVAERVRAFREQTLPDARRAADEGRRRAALRREDETVWAELEELSRRLEALHEERRTLEESLAGLEREVEAATAAGGATPFHERLAAYQSARDAEWGRIEARLTELRAEAGKVRGEQKALAEESDQLRPLAEAVGEHRWWSAAWWRARAEGDVVQRLAELEGRGQKLAAEAERLGREETECVEARDRAEATYQEALAAARREEVGRRRAEGEARLTALACDARTIGEKGRAAGRRLTGGAEPPADLSAGAVLAARAAWRGLLEQDERQAEAAAQWAEAVEAALPTLPDRLTQCVNVVGALTSGLASDPHFGDKAPAAPPFDLLILEDAHLVTESEFLAAARRARRWVLIGEPTDDAPRRAARTNALRPGFFQRLWRLLHGDPRALPYAWFRRGGRLACRLRPASPDEERWVQSENLADRPDVELRIAAPPRTAPRLLEVVFPAATTIHEAKSLLFRELGELTVQACGGEFRWREAEDRLTLDLSEGIVADCAAVELSDGVREWVANAATATEAGACWQTRSLEFDRSAGWTRERAEQWLEEHLQARDLGRTVRLRTTHRCRPALARFLVSLLFDGAGAVHATDDASCAVEFVPVPAPGDAPARPRPAPPRADEGGGGAAVAVTPRTRVARGGAGLETDLDDPRRSDALSAELRSALPTRGIVNWFEARAVVRKLESLAADPSFLAAAHEWARPQGSHATVCGGCRGGAVLCACGRPAVAVLALYSAQAELIRLLMSRSPALAGWPAAVEVATPDAFRHRECYAALVSLTRSHAHRAVPFGDDPALLPAALTRAASRLVVFGDPGTLARRCQWNGPLDHLDEAAGEGERRLIDRITAYLHGRGPHPSVFRIDESGGV